MINNNHDKSLYLELNKAIPTSVIFLAFLSDMLFFEKFLATTTNWNE